MSTATTPAVDFRQIALASLTENPRNPRQHFDAEAIAELADSLKEKGLLQPIVVRQVGEGYEIVCGHRRSRAARLAGLETVPALVHQLDDRAALEAAIIENSQREDVTPLEEADAFKALVDDGVEVDELAAQIGRPARFVRDRLRLHDLIPELCALLGAGKLPLGGALLLAMQPAGRQEALFHGYFDDENTDSWRVSDVKKFVGWSSKALRYAPWDLTDGTLGGRGACASCTVRSGAQAGLWGDDDDDSCLDTVCYEQHKAAWVAQQKASGVTVEDGYPPYGAMETTRVCEGVTPETTWGALAESVGVAATLYINAWSGIRWYVDPGPVALALKAEGRLDEFNALVEAGGFRLPPTAEERARQKAESDARRLEMAREDEAKEKRRDAVIQHAVGASAGAEQSELILLLVQAAIARGGYRPIREVCARWGLLADDASADEDDRQAALAAHAGLLAPDVQFGLLVELHLVEVEDDWRERSGEVARAFYRAAGVLEEEEDGGDGGSI